MSCWMLLLFSCMPVVTPWARHGAQPPADSGQQDDTGGAGDTVAVLATVADDFSLGALATVNLQTWNISDGLAPISGDPVVVAAGQWLVQLNRYNYDTVRLYQPSAWLQPLWEVSLADGANPLSRTTRHTTFAPHPRPPAPRRGQQSRRLVRSALTQAF